MQIEETSTARAEIASTGGDLSPCLCPRCNWLGTDDKTGDASSCPECHAKANPLRQKGLDSLRTHYRLLSKLGYPPAFTLQQKDIERTRLEQFFQRIGAPL